MPLSKEQVWISIKLWGLKTRFLATKLVAIAGLVLALFGGYTIIQPGVSVTYQSTLIGALPIVQGLTSVDGVLILVIGIVLVGVATRT